MDTKHKTTVLDKILKILFAFYVFTIFVFSSNLDTIFINKIAVIMFCGVAFLLFFSTYTIRLDEYFWHFFVFVAFTFLSSLWAANSSLAITKGITLVQILVVSVFGYSFFYAIDDAEFIIKAVFISGMCMCIYILYIYGLDTYIEMLLNGIRAGREISNVNGIGSYASITVIIGLYYAIFKNKKLYYLLILLPMFIALGTGSRKVMLVLLIGGFLLFAFKFQNNFTAKNVVKTLIVFIVVVLGFYFVLQLEIFSTINERMQSFLNLFTGKGEVDYSTLERQAMIEAGIEQFKKTPILGIGIGNSFVITMQHFGVETYLHNNYIELLACGGIVGFACFYAMYVYLAVEFIKLVRQKKEIAYLPLAMIIITLVNAVALVSYYDKTTYIYLIYYFLILKKEKQKEMQNEY